MDLTSINYLAVIVCVVLSMVIGFIWYSPKVFFNIWWRGIGKTEADPSDPSPMLWFFTIIAAFVEAVAVALMVRVMDSHTLGFGLLTGFMLWLGFVAPTNLVNKLFAGHGFKVWAIEAGNHLVYMLVCGAILSVW